MQYIITKNLQILSSNIKDKNIITELLKCKNENERLFCEIKNSYKRQGKIRINSLNFFLCSYEQNITNKIFKHYINAFKIIGSQIDINLKSIKTKEENKTRRLKHNLINHNSHILQELYKLVPQDAYKNGSNHIDVIDSIISKSTRKTSYTYLKILKSSNLMKAEFDVYEMIDNDNPYLDFSEHPIHKVLILTLNPFWLDLVEQKVNIVIQPFYEKVYIDYKSISVSLSHIFDNTTKYILPNSELNISFSTSQNVVSIKFTMTSLKVEEDEIEDIFKERISGKWSKENDTSGDGIGMFMVKKLILLNNGRIKFRKNINNNSAINFNGIPYENNCIEIELNKKSG